MSDLKVYLAGHRNAEAYRKEASAFLAAHNIEVIDPLRRDFRGKESDNVEKIVRGDIEDVATAGLILANFSENSVGTSMESWLAFSIGKPVISFVERPDLRLSPWAHYISATTYTSLQEALEACLKFA